MNGKHLISTGAACLLLAVLLTTFNACKSNDETVEPASDVLQQPYNIDNVTGEVTLRTDCGGTDVHWEYEGVDGPSHWGDLCEAWGCDGYKQSPVNIVPPRGRSLSRHLKFFWKNTSTNIVNNGHTIQYNIDQSSSLTNSSYITLNGQKYYLLQFHFHAASEHTVDGVQYPAEIHFVHRNPDNGKLAVVGVFVEEGDENPFFEHIADTWPHDEGSFVSADTFDPSALMPAGYNDSFNAHFWYYDGSLTTPPCSEIVNWMVWMTTIEASHEQLMEMEDILHENYRPVQPMGARVVQAQ